MLNEEQKKIVDLDKL